jgi:NDP-sugar pyrophosphorylase family protein
MTGSVIAGWPAVLLVGGIGTRLRSAFSAGPKCLAPIAGRPFLDYMVSWLRGAGIGPIVLSVGYKAEHVEEWALARGGDIVCKREPEPLGTAGGVKFAASDIQSDRFFVLNGDSMFAVDLAALAISHKQRGALATLALARVPQSDRYGSVEFGPDGSILRFVEKGSASPAPSTDAMQCINGGVYIFEKRVIDRIPPGRSVSLETEVFPSLVGKGFFASVQDGFFIDIGIPSDYERAQLELPRRFPL